LAVDGGPGGAALVCPFERGFWLYPHPLSKRAVLVGMLREPTARPVPPQGTSTSFEG